MCMVQVGAAPLVTPTQTHQKALLFSAIAALTNRHIVTLQELKAALILLIRAPGIPGASTVTPPKSISVASLQPTGSGRSTRHQQPLVFSLSAGIIL